MLKVIMNKMNTTIEDILTNKARNKIQEELNSREPEPKRTKKIKTYDIPYAGKYEIVNNFIGYAKQHIKDMLREKKVSDLMVAF